MYLVNTYSLKISVFKHRVYHAFESAEFFIQVGGMVKIGRKPIS